MDHIILETHLCVVRRENDEVKVYMSPSRASVISKILGIAARNYSKI